MRAAAVIAVACMFAAVAGFAAWEKAAREHEREVVAKECIEGGGKYHETWFRRRPKCKEAR